MAAGTVISGGFPGRVAQEVHPNQKCEGCLHYDSQGGRTGVCTIGLRPDNCGHGEAPDVSYAPIARGAGSYLPDMGNHAAQAPEVGPQVVSGLYGSGSTRPVNVQQVSLGEEHLHVVKSVIGRHAELQKSQCLRCSMRGAHGTAPHNVDPQPCTCRPIEAATVAKAVVARMSNALRARISLDGVTAWVREVAKAGFRLPAHSRGGVLADVSKASIDDRVRIEDTGGHLRPIMKAAPAPPGDAVEKSFYSDDWIAQFKGTPLFDEARKLCERELKLEEDELARREKNIEREKARRAEVKPDYDWQESDNRRSKIRIAKQRLALKLAGLHQQKMTAATAGR